MRPRIVTALLCLALMACGASRGAILSRTATGLDAARASFLIEDERLQRSILDKADTNAQAAAELAKFQAKRDKVLVAIEAAYLAVLVASLDPTDLNMAEVITTGAAVLDLYRDIKGAPWKP